MIGAKASIDVHLINGPVTFASIEPFPQSAGGECVFFGRTRFETHLHFGRLRRLRYEAYTPMAQTMLRDLAQQAVARFDCVAVRVHHAVGEIPIGQASVVVQVACAHRAAAFDACRFLIDRLKSLAPIWKHEVWEFGQSTWSSGTAVEVLERP